MKSRRSRSRVSQEYLQAFTPLRGQPFVQSAHQSACNSSGLISPMSSKSALSQDLNASHDQVKRESKQETRIQIKQAMLGQNDKMQPLRIMNYFKPSEIGATSPIVSKQLEIIKRRHRLLKHNKKHKKIIELGE